MVFSIIIPTYNPGDRLKNTLDSILVQSFSDYEIVIKDSIRSVNTFSIIKEYLENSEKIKYYCFKDESIYDGMNQGTYKAQGDYCIFLGAGDKFADEYVLEDLFNTIINKKCDIVYGYVIQIKDYAESTYKKKLNWLYPILFRPVCHQSVCAKKELLLNFPFNIEYKCAADQDWLMRMQKLKKKIIYINRPISFFPIDGFSAENVDLFTFEREIIHEKYYPFWQKIKYSLKSVKNMFFHNCSQ